MFGFEDIIIVVIFGGVGLLLIILGMYFRIVSIKFRKSGVKTKFKVLEVTTEQQLGDNDKVIGEFYITKFEFIYNGKTLTETIQTHKCFEPDTEIEGIYLPDAKLNKISVAGEGFQMAKGAEFCLIGFGLFILFLVFATVFKLPIKIIIAIIIAAFVFVFGGMLILRLSTRQKKK